MTKEKETVLIKDLCGRLQHNTVMCIEGLARPILQGIVIDTKIVLVSNHWYDLDEVKPYLRKVESMTEEEMDKLFDILHVDRDGNDEDWIKINDVLGIKFFLPSGRWMEEMDKAMDYLYSIHIDINGLIHEGLAVEAPEKMYKEL